jgi:hypothetical protein
MKTAAMVINEMEVFPKGRYDDLTDFHDASDQIYPR